MNSKTTISIDRKQMLWILAILVFLVLSIVAINHWNSIQRTKDREKLRTTVLNSTSFRKIENLTIEDEKVDSLLIRELDQVLNDIIREVDMANRYSCYVKQPDGFKEILFYRHKLEPVSAEMSKILRRMDEGPSTDSPSSPRQRNWSESFCCLIPSQSIVIEICGNRE